MRIFFGTYHVSRITFQWCVFNEASMTELYAPPTELILEMRGIDKSFPGVHALRSVNLTVARGEVLGLVGENGAGKSTLIKILSGAYTRDRGEIRIGGQVIDTANPHEMIERGVAVIYQEPSLASHLTTAENIFMGRLPQTKWGLVDWPKLEHDTLAVGLKLGLKLRPRARVQYLSVAQRQMVEIAKALSRDARLIVLDEPSAVLGEAELAGLFALIRRLAEQGVAFIYISHRLNEVFEIADRVTVMKDGQVGHLSSARPGFWTRSPGGAGSQPARRFARGQPERARGRNPGYRRAGRFGPDRNSAGHPGGRPS
jgi:ABC-type sugar transport system ATPase subunit